MNGRRPLLVRSSIARVTGIRLRTIWPKTQCQGTARKKDDAISKDAMKRGDAMAKDGMSRDGMKK
jgi:hypothetical protein